VAVTSNQRGAAGALDAGSAGATDDLSILLGTVASLSALEARKAYEQLSGMSLAAFPTPQLVAQARFDMAVRARGLGRLEAPLPGEASFAAAEGGGMAGPARSLGLGQMAEIGRPLAASGPARSAAPRARQTGPRDRP